MQWAGWLAKFIKLEFIVFALFQLFIPVFHVTKWNSVIGIIGVFLPIQVYLYMKYRLASERFVISGVAFLIISALIHGLKYDLHPTYLDHKSLGHLFIVCFIVVNYLGIKQKSPAAYATETISS
jgi:hypothetical protein